MKPGIHPSISPRPIKPAKRKRSQPLPGWLAGAIFLGGVLIVGAIFAFLFREAGYEGPDKYPEFRELKKEYLAIQTAETEKAKLSDGRREGSAGAQAASALPPEVAASTRQIQQTDPTLKAMLTWFNSLPSEQRATLEKTGKLRFPFADLRKSDPERAKYLEQYVASQTASRPGKVLPQTVRIDKTGPGEYDIGVETNIGGYVFEQIFPDL